MGKNVKTIRHLRSVMNRARRELDAATRKAFDAKDGPDALAQSDLMLSAEQRYADASKFFWNYVNDL